MQDDYEERNYSSSSMAKVFIADKKEPVTLFENMIFKIIESMVRIFPRSSYVHLSINIVLIIVALCMLQDDILNKII